MFNYKGANKWQPLIPEKKMKSKMLNETRWTKENLTKKLMIKNSYITIHTTQPVALIFKADVAF